MPNPITVIVTLIIIFVVLGVCWACAKRYRKVPPNEVLVVYGRKTKEGRGYRVVAGGAAFIVPVLEEYSMISLNLIQIPL